MQFFQGLHEVIDYKGEALPLEKPRIRLISFYAACGLCRFWRCGYTCDTRSENRYGWGTTPEEAYQHWQGEIKRAFQNRKNKHENI